MKVVLSTILRGAQLPDSLVQPLLDCSIAVFARVREAIVAVPCKPHYVYCLRNCLDAVRGIARIRCTDVEDEQLVFRLFKHEHLRVYGDRLSDAADQILLERILQTQLMAFNSNWASHLAERVMFGDYVTHSREKDSRVYESVGIDRAARRMEGSRVE